MPIIINRSGRDLQIPEIQKIIPGDGKQYFINDDIFRKYRNYFEYIPVELHKTINDQQIVIDKLNKRNRVIDILKLCNSEQKPFDFLYSFDFDKNMDDSIVRLKSSIKSIISQNVNVCVCNTSVKCIKKHLKEFNIKYIHIPKVKKIYCKSETINLGVENLVFSKYFFTSDIDLIYPPTFIEYMGLFKIGRA